MCSSAALCCLQSRNTTLFTGVQQRCGLWLPVYYSNPLLLLLLLLLCLLSVYAFSALTLLVGRQEGIQPVKTEWWGAGVIICLERDADLHMAQLMPLPLTVSCFSKIQIGFTFWYWLTWVVPKKGR